MGTQCQSILRRMAVSSASVQESSGREVLKEEAASLGVCSWWRASMC